ncbi:2-(1,2-epoxy-1,2-dihydrophenyl)acetyl-CoA isomerase PaaG [Polycladidibacter hongkongensis]|uniref:2-(1,2-epoxy-1,2-dihydrophenyl)acetyl-CoA isomerase PaaG n=1 Tax=Polycladidibacter hongkongensis TaxID=1647556 RepID=UPI000832BEB3|nr:2-(1,2-epoxy-1,2-dihydrophenyl)acetyl-CoA isomerase PaaG [Pseudovibrio hongkongensis]
MSQTILTSRQEAWVKITLNRPDRLNSFNEEMHLAFRDALTNAANDASCRAVLITGSGRGFCAGQDLGDRDPTKMKDKPDLGATLQNFYNPNITLIREMEKPVICAVNGVAAGAGANLALACDVTFAATSAKFIESFANVGLVPDAGGTWTLPHLIGAQRAKAIAMTAMPITAAQAESWGMIWQALADEDMPAAAEEFTARIASGPTTGFALTKAAMNAAPNNTFAQQLQLEAEYQRKAGHSADYAEGVTAFLQKRKPAFTGA